MQWVLSKSMEKEENQKVRFKKKKNAMKPQQKEKVICRKEGEEAKTKPAQSQGKRREREVKIRKNTAVH